MKCMRAGKRAMLFAIGGTFLCLAMLVGMTFAWFTESIDTGENVIKTGSFDVSISYAETLDGDFEEISDDTSVLFNGVTLSPGESSVRYIKITNASEYELVTDLVIKAITAAADNSFPGSMKVYVAIDPTEEATEWTEMGDLETLAGEESTTVISDVDVAAMADETPAEKLLAIKFEVPEDFDAPGSEVRFQLQIIAAQKQTDAEGETVDEAVTGETGTQTETQTVAETQTPAENTNETTDAADDADAA